MLKQQKSNKNGTAKVPFLLGTKSRSVINRGCSPNLLA
jgi:hypothetical protein